MNNMHRSGVLGVAVAVATAIAGCTTSAGAAGTTPAGEPNGTQTPSTASQAITLTIGTDDNPGVPAADQIQEFARQVAALSNGSITIEPRWHAAGDTPNWDQAVARLVMSGKLDLGLIPSRAWDALGVTSLEPLNAPFLIRSDQALRDVITGDLAQPLMAGLKGAGVEGIAMFPEGFRRPFGYDSALLGPHQYKGATLRVPTSRVSKKMYAALGAKVVDSEADPATQRARESSFLLVEPGSAVATGNVVFYPKVNVLVAGSDAAARLTPEQRAVIEQAAVAARDVGLASQPSDPTSAQQFCTGGGAVENVSAADLARLVKATAPVVDGIAALPGNRELVDRIRAIADGAPPVAIAECRDTTSFGVGDQTVLDGSYRFELTADEVKKAGISDQHEIDQDIGLWTWKIADGHWTMTQTAGPDAGTETGPLWINKNVVIFKWPTNPPESYSWKADKDGSLTLTPIDVPAGKNAEVQMTLKRWERIG